MHDAAQAVNPRHPRAVPRRADRRAGRRAVHSRSHEGIVGFYGASSMERLPVEPAITGRVREFCGLKFRRQA